ncbi:MULTISPECIES: hypothetical protein [Sphingobacterium]|uniref:hypothetical protein n=1 Tax=Sphingobacterium TaxID=28453 RepID=UPI00257EFA1D|nr:MULTISPECIES: hypothetical protein [Sphingobacterium]
MSQVKLRKKNISNGKQSLYLDIYPPIYNPDTGKMKRKHYLELHIYKRPKTDVEKNYNQETMALAEYIRAQRQIDLQNRRFDFVSDCRFRIN